jgi:hypothetical protein
MGEKERTIRAALEGWDRTARWCTIYVASRVVPAVVAIVTILMLRR